MNRNRPVFSLGSLVILALVFSACGVVSGNTVRGSGNVKTETRTVSGFTSVALAGVGDLVLQFGESEALTIEAEDNLLPLITSEVKDGRLTLGVQERTSLQTTKPIHYTVIVKTLTEVVLSGAGTITAPKMALPKLLVMLSGTGSITAYGSADELMVVVSGAGSFVGSNLAAKTANVTMSGTGSASVNVSDKLDATLSGAGAIDYVGDPTVNKNVTGAGQIRKR